MGGGLPLVFAALFLITGCRALCHEIESPYYWCLATESSARGTDASIPTAPCDTGWISSEEKLRKCPCVSFPTTGTWSECSTTCGGGTMYRNMTVLSPGVAGCSGRERVPCNRRPCGEVGRGLRVATLQHDSIHVGQRRERVARDWLRPEEDATQQAGAMNVVPLEENRLRITWGYSGAVYTAVLNANDEIEGDISGVSGVEARGASQSAFGALQVDGTVAVHFYDSLGPPTVLPYPVNPALGDTRLADATLLHDGQVVTGVYTSAVQKGSVEVDGDYEAYYLPDTREPHPDWPPKEWRCVAGESQQLVWHPWLQLFVTACVSPCRAAKLMESTFAVFTSGGNRSAWGEAVTVHDLPANCTGRRVAGTVGPLVPVPEGVLVVYTAPDTDFDGPFDVTTVALQVFVARLHYSNGWSVSRRTRISSSSASRKTSPQLARVGSGHEGDGYLAGWEDNEGFYVVRLSHEISVISDIEPVDSWAVWGDRNNWVTTEEGEVAWVYSWDFHEASRNIAAFPAPSCPFIKVVRYHSSFPETIDTSPNLRCQGQGNGNCTETYQVQEDLGSHSESAPTGIIIAAALLVVLLGAIAVLTVRHSRSRVVGQRRRSRAPYPWEADGKDDADDVEFLEYSKI